MCYKSPGPRCDQEVLMLLLATQRSTGKGKHLFVEEHCELLMTRGGLVALAKTISETDEGEEREALLSAYKTGHANFVRKMSLIGKTPRAIAGHPDLDGVEYERDVEVLAKVSASLYENGPLQGKMETLATKLAKTDASGEKYCDTKVLEYAHSNQSSLKDASVAQMHEEVVTITRDLPVADAARVLEAASLAEYLHRNDVRKTPTRNSSGIARDVTDPYIIHPLRNTLRIARWDCRDADVLAASMLHDTVEDHPKDLAVTYAGADPDGTEEEHREAALKYLSKTFGPKTARYVELMSNPILDGETRRDKKKSDAAYAAHVEEAVDASPYVLVLKVSDFVDNALSAHAGTIDKRTIARTKKYVPLVPVFASAIKKHRKEMHNIVSSAGVETIERRVDRAGRYLADIISLEDQAA